MRHLFKFLPFIFIVSCSRTPESILLANGIDIRNSNYHIELFEDYSAIQDESAHILLFYSFIL